jgi:hypothetical protein
MKTSPKPGSVRATIHELRGGTFLASARMRSSRRKSPWNLLLMFCVPVWLVLWTEGVHLARVTAKYLFQSWTVPEDWIWPGAIAPLLIYFPLLFATLIPAMVLVNYAIYLLIPPARRAMDAEDKAFPGTGYATQQPILLRLALITLPPAFGLAVIGFVCR